MCSNASIHEEGNSTCEFVLWLYDEFYRLMFFTAQKYLADPAQLEEVVQESLRKLIEKADRLQSFPRAILAGYIVATVRNTALTYRKRQVKHSRVISLEDVDLEAPDDRESMDESLIRQEELAGLQAIWSQLSREDQLLLEGKYLLEYSDPELAQLLGCQSASVRMKLTRARRRAQKLLKKEGVLDEEQ